MGLGPVVLRMLFFIRGSLEATLPAAEPPRKVFLICGSSPSVAIGVGTVGFFNADFRGCAAGLGFLVVGTCSG